MAFNQLDSFWQSPQNDNNIIVSHSLRMTEACRAVFYLPLAPLWEADCELRANRLAEVQDCADPLNANNQAGQGEGQISSDRL